MPDRPRIAWTFGPIEPAATLAGSGAVAWVGSADHARGIIADRRPTPWDREDAGRHPPAARPAFLQRRALLRGVVARSLDVAIDQVAVSYDALGRPRLRPPLAGFAISAASRDGWFAAAVAARPVGIDIERIAAPADPAWTILHPSERTALNVRPPADRWEAFLAIWTAKEAYLKALGLGLSREPSDIAVGLADTPAVTLHDRDRPVATHAAAWASITDGRDRVTAACVVLPDGLAARRTRTSQ